MPDSHPMSQAPAMEATVLNLQQTVKSLDITIRQMSYEQGRLQRELASLHL